VGWAKARSAVPIRKSARASRRSALCRHANVERIEVGPKGAVLAFRDNIFANPEGLIAYIAKHPRGRARSAGHEGHVLRRMGHAAGAA
jgi:hypothetical protein